MLIILPAYGVLINILLAAGSASYAVIDQTPFAQNSQCILHTVMSFWPFYSCIYHG
jgi:hypothetical protein